MQPPLSQQVVVITGASSGIGHCAALHLAARGARVALVARSADALAEVEEAIQRRDGAAVALPADVTSEEELEAVVEGTLARWGRIDTWINGAAVYAQGRVQDFELDEYRRILEVNLLGTIHGTMLALGPMLEQGSGVIVQVSSIVALRGAPFSSPYSASKQGIEGFSEAARSELVGSGVKISTLYLPAVDTPIYQHARAKLGGMPKPPPPVVDPERVAAAIAELCESGERKRHVGLFHYLYSAPGAISPALGGWFLHHMSGLTRSSRAPEGDNLDRPTGAPARIRGGWAEPGWRGLTLGEIARVLPVETAIGTLALAGAAGLLWRKLRAG